MQYFATKPVKKLICSEYRRGNESFIKFSSVEFTLYGLRHTYATLLYDTGVDIKAESRWLGHTNESFTLKTYAKLTAEREAKSVDALCIHIKNIINP